MPENLSQFKEIKAQLANKSDLSLEQAYNLQKLILSNQFDTEGLVELFGLLDAKGAITQQELFGFFKASQEAMVGVDTGMETLDTCGTGGGGASTFNISTAAAIVCAAAGVPVAKHGNRAATSLCGSADVLESLGVRIDLNSQEVPEALKKHNFAFMFARAYHPAFKFVGQARKQFGKKTYFNLLGPLLNPAKAPFRVHGFANPDYIEILGKILIESGVKKAWLLRSRDNMDEISPFALTDVYEFIQGGQIKQFTIDPLAYGFGEGELEDLKGGDSGQNAEIIMNVFKNQANPAQTATVILNAAAGLTVFGKATDFGAGVDMAREIIISGRADEKLKELQT